MRDRETLITQALDFIAAPPMSTDHRARDYCYQPCRHGLHVCGYHPDGENYLTVVNLPTDGPRGARLLFDAAFEQLAQDKGEPADLIVDLCQNGNTEEDFALSRQMLERLVRIWASGGQADA